MWNSLAVFQALQRIVVFLFRQLGTYLAACLAALALVSTPVLGEDGFLEPTQAFQFSVQMEDAQTIVISYVIADGYYMYRERFKFSADGATLGTPVFTPGKVKFDETFQKNVETYHDRMSVRIPVQANGNFTLHAISQGCSEKGLCYSPMESKVLLSFMSGSVTNKREPASFSNGAGSFPKIGALLNPDINGIGELLKSKKLLFILPLFFLFGLGLSFTPCVLPMVPILSYVIVGEGTQVSRRTGLALSVVYSAGMALVYASLGIVSGLLGEGLSAYLQNGWVLGSFSLLIAVLALSMFDLYHLRMPAVIEHEMHRISKNQKAGKFIGVFVMGALSALILSPCVTAPLTGVLLYIGQTRDAFFGGLALLTIAIGMSVPLILVGVSAGTLLPRAGAWMNAVKRFFGVLMLAMALWIASPLIPAMLSALMWAALFAAYGIYLIYPKNGGGLAKVIGFVFVLLAAALAFGGIKNLGQPQPAQTNQAFKASPFTRIKTVADLDTMLAQSSGKPVMLDFYADWCVACKEMEKLTFSDARVQKQLADFVLIQVDVTANDSADREMLRRFRLFGPPGIIFFNGQGAEVILARVIGYQDTDKFQASLDFAKANK